MPRPAYIRPRRVKKLPHVEEGEALELFDLDDDKIALPVFEKLADLDRLNGHRRATFGGEFRAPGKQALG